jgi:hypothetical protein
MNRADFDKLVSDTVKVTADLLIAKGAEYAGDGDRLANFKRNAARNGQTVLETWMTYWNKHIDSIHTYMARVKDRATELALQEIIETDKIAIETNNGELRRENASAQRFRNKVNECLPSAMREIEAQLSEGIEGRFHDNINYSFLCLGILKELKGEEE